MPSPKPFNPSPPILPPALVIPVKSFTSTPSTSLMTPRAKPIKPTARATCRALRRRHQPPQSASAILSSPEMVRLPPMERIVCGAVCVQRDQTAASVGAISITVIRTVCRGSRGRPGRFPRSKFSKWFASRRCPSPAQEVVTELKGHLIRPHPQLLEEEAYTVFCIASPGLNA